MAIKVFDGIFRKIAVPFIGLSAFGWLLVVIGFGIGSNEDEDKHPGFSQSMINDKDEPSSYPCWMVCFSGPFTFIAALLHAALWKPLSPLIGAVTAFLSVLYVSGLGMILFWTGFVIYNKESYLDSGDIPGWFKLEFDGAFLATLFWMVVIALWPFYDGIREKEQY